jgi:hypothetical protein
MIPLSVKRPLGIVLILVGVIGIILGGVGIYQIWQAKTGLESGLQQTIDTAQQTIIVTRAALTTAVGSLDTVGTNLTNVNNTLLTVAQSLNDAVPVLDSFATLMQEELPTTLEATQAALETAEASAQLLDSVMRAITSIPFYPGESYNPPVPLDVSVQNVATSLEPLPASLIKLGGELESNQENFSEIETDLIALSVTLTELSTPLGEAKTTLTEYQTLLTTVETQLEGLEDRLPGIINTGVWFLSILIFWLIFTQVGLIIQGLTFMEPILVSPAPLNE